MRFTPPGCTTPRGRGRPSGAPPARGVTRTSTRSTRTRALVALSAVLGALALVAPAGASAAVQAQTYASGVTFPFNGVWLDSADGGHYWDASGNGLCRIDADALAASGFSENAGTCDVQAKKPTQAVVGPKNADGTYYVYAADMSSKSGGPVRVTYDPNADPPAVGQPGRGAIVAGSGVLLGGLNTVGFFSDAGGNFKNSSVQLGPCDQTTGAATAGQAGCTALYLGFERSKKIERINNVDQPVAQQSIETISKTTDKRKGVRFGLGLFHNPDGTADLYISELGGNGVSLLKNVAQCAPSEGSADPTIVNPPVNTAGGCAAPIVGGITTNFPQGMVVSKDSTGNDQYLYYSDSPRDGTATILRYNPATGIQDVVSSAVVPYDSLLNPGQSVSTYTYVLGLAINPHTGDLFIGDDPTFAILVNPPLAKGHVFVIHADATGNIPVDCAGTATTPCVQPPAPSAATPALYAYGLTAPKGGVTFMPDAKTNPDGSQAGHLWAADHSQGLCRMDVVKDTTGTTLGINAFNAAHCDDGSLLGSGGQTVFDPDPVPGSIGTNLHYVYVAQNDHLSPGVLRFVYDEQADGGEGDIVAGTGEVMAPNAGLTGDKANGLALGACKPGAPPSCTHALYMGGLLDGFIRRINNPEEPLARNMTVDVVAMTTEQRTGVAGKGINGSMGLIHNADRTDDLYLPENQGFTVVKDIAHCPAAGQVCGTVPLNIAQFGFIFGSAVGVDPDPQHLRSQAGLVYAAVSPGASPATVYQYDIATNTSRVYATRGQMPPAGSAEATVYCTTTCTRPVDPANPPGGPAAFKFAQGVMADDNGSVYLTEDAFAGARGGRGHAWIVNGLPYPAGATPVPLPIPAPPPATNQTCNLTVNIPALASGQTYWVQFTSHAAGQLSSTWKLPVAQSAQQLLYPGNPFNGLADPVSTGAKGGAIAKQVTSNTASFSITTAPSQQAAGTYTVQFFNGSNGFGPTTGTITYTNDGASACPANPVTAHVIP